jgi:hypothetical protein
MDLIIRNISLFFGENLDYIDKGYIIIKRGIIKRVGSGDYEGGYDDPIMKGKVYLHALDLLMLTRILVILLERI